ncbi:hypothetical protein [Kribbella deserti]|uniref:DUF4352 domain-containing protein n=1 Tax=Kribbella deserti TaxID=1926257 RepID=A0ABV6QN65_9ACTN
MNHRKIATLFCGTALLIAGCGSVDRPESAEALESAKAPEPTITVSSAPASPPSPTSDGNSSITESGTTLPVGRTATVLFETKPQSKQSTKLATTVLSVKKGSIGDLKNFKLDAHAKMAVPFYVTVKFRNVGPKSMEPTGIFGLIKAQNPAGEDLGKLSLFGEFKPCGGIPPEQLPQGATFTQCSVYLAPAGQKVGKVVFGFYLGNADRTEISWTTG